MKVFWLVKRCPWLIPIAVLLTFFSIFFFRLLFGSEVFYCCDNLLITIPARLFFVREVMAGRFPLWSPYLFSGTPFVADLNLSPLYIGNFLYFLLSPFRALTALTILHVFLGMVGMYWCCRTFSLSRWSSVLGAVIFSFSGTIMTYTNNSPMIQVAAYLPWIIGLVRRLRDRRQIGVLLALMAVGSLQVFAGHPQITFYTWLLVAGLVIGTFPERMGRKFVFLAVPIIGIFLLTSVQLLPFGEFALLSTRIGKGYGYATQGSLPITALVRLIIPSVVGSARAGTDWWQGGSVLGFIGVIPLFFIAAAWKKERERLVLFIFLIVSFLGAFGSNTPVFRLLYLTIPGIGLFRVPSQLLIITTFTGALLGAFGGDELIGSRNRSRIFGRACLIVGILFLIGGAASLVLVPALLPKFLMIPKVAGKLAYLGSAGLSTIIRGVSENLLISGALFVVAGFLSFKQLIRHKRERGILICAVFIELFLFSRMNLISVSSIAAGKLLMPPTLIADQPVTNGRLFVDPSVYANPHPKTFGWNYYWGESEWQTQTLRPNTGMNAGIALPDGYAAIIWAEYAKEAGTYQDPTGVTFSPISFSRLAKRGVSYVLLRDRAPYNDISDAVAVRKGNGGVTLYMLPQARPLVFIDHAGTPEPVAYSQLPDETRVSLPSGHASERLVVLTANYPGWVAMAGDRELPIVPFEQVFQQITIPPGVNTITIAFHSRTVQFGLIISVISWMVWIIAVWRLRGQKFR